MDPRLENWGGEGYADYQGYMKVSGGEKTAANQTATEASQLTQWMGTQFQEQQNLLNNVLMPQLRQMATNPQGFGPQALAAMRAQTIGTIGGQLSAQEKTLANQFATQNMAGLGSGVQAALGANLAQGAAGQEASNLGQIAIANAQAQQQQREFGLQGLAQGSQLLGQAPQSAGLAVQASGTSFNEQYKMAQQGGLMQNILGGLAGAGMGFLTGGPAGAIAGGIGGFAKSAAGGGADNTSVLGGGGALTPGTWWTNNMPSWLGGRPMPSMGQVAAADPLSGMQTAQLPSPLADIGQYAPPS